MAQLADSLDIEDEMDAQQISQEIGVPVRTVQRWLSTRPDIFPSVRRTRPTKTGRRVVSRADVIAYKEKYLKQ